MAKYWNKAVFSMPCCSQSLFHKVESVHYKQTVLAERMVQCAAKVPWPDVVLVSSIRQKVLLANGFPRN